MCVFPTNPQSGTTAECFNSLWAYDGYGWVRVNNVIPGNFTITGSLTVDGEIISKTRFSGYTGDSDIEYLDNLSLDGGEF